RDRSARRTQPASAPRLLVPPRPAHPQSLARDRRPLERPGANEPALKPIREGELTMLSGIRHSLAIVRCALGAAALPFILGAKPAMAAGDWRVNVTPYVWATDLRVKADLNGRQVVDQDVSVSDLVKKLDTIFQGRVDVQYRRVGLATDLFDVT